MHPDETTLYSGQVRPPSPPPHPSGTPRCFTPGDAVPPCAQSEYQQIIVVEWHGDITLYIDGFSQFSSREEFRYHECLVHPIMSASLTQAVGAPPPPQRVLLLGAGDGLAARELLRYGERLGSIDLVDLDPHMTSLFREDSGSAIPQMVELTERSMSDERLTLHHTDAGQYVTKYAATGAPKYDVIIIDLPDPMMGVQPLPPLLPPLAASACRPAAASSRRSGAAGALSDLYSLEFYREVFEIAAPRGIVVTQATGLLSTKESFWCIDATMRQAVTRCSLASSRPPALRRVALPRSRSALRAAARASRAGCGRTRPTCRCAPSSPLQPPCRSALTRRPSAELGGVGLRDGEPRGGRPRERRVAAAGRREAVPLPQPGDDAGALLLQRGHQGRRAGRVRPAAAARPAARPAA